MNILFVDDEIDYLNTLIKRMHKRKINAFALASGKEVISFLEKNQIDCVVLDVKMPEMDGAQVLKEIKILHPSIEVLMLTGHADMDVALDVMEHGAFDYLMKPIDIEELLYKLQDAYEKKSIDVAKMYHSNEPPE